MIDTHVRKLHYACMTNSLNFVKLWNRRMIELAFVENNKFKLSEVDGCNNIELS